MNHRSSNTGECFEACDTLIYKSLDRACIDRRPSHEAKWLEQTQHIFLRVPKLYSRHSNAPLYFFYLSLTLDKHWHRIDRGGDSNPLAPLLKALLTPALPFGTLRQVHLDLFQTR